MLAAQVISGGYSIVNLVILAIIVAGVIGIALIAIRAAGLDIPAWVIQIFWVVLVVVVAILAIRLLLSLI